MKNISGKYSNMPHNYEKQYFPLSFQQERVLYLHNLLPDSTLWNRISCKRLKGNVNVSFLKRAIEDLIDRHTVLKTKVSSVDNEPVQSLQQSKEDVFQFVELSSLPDSQRGPQITNLLNKEYQTPINVKGGWLFKAILIMAGESDYTLILKLHHIISDATTFQIIWRDLKLTYNSYLLNGRHGLPRLNMNYHDYALWQRDIFDERHTKEQETYWLNRFAGEIPVLALPADFSSPPQISFRGAVEKAVLPKELVKSLESFSLQKRVILFSTLLSAFYLLLQKYCCQDDIVVGTVFSGRHYSPDIRNVAGLFVNTVALRIRVDDDLAFEKLVRQIHELVSDAYLMQDYPLERLVQKINPERNNSRNPLFRAMFNVVTGYKENHAFSGVREESWMEPEINSTQVDLFLHVHADPEDTRILLEYNTDIFRKKTVERILKHYINLLRGVTNKPQSKAHELDMLDPEEREQFLAGWNDTHAQYPHDKCVHELFEEQAEKTPGQTAIMLRDRKLTYRELNEKSNQLARYLRENGVSAGSIVGIMVERSFELIIGLLGILKAGGAYLPIDPGYPEERISYLLEDSGANILLVRKPVESSLLEAAGGRTVKAIQINISNIYSVDGSNLKNVNKPAELAYVMYTSGSTGKPKGVMVEHISIVNTLAFLQKKYPLLKNDAYLLKTTCSFDVSLAELFGWFFEGGRLAILEPEAEKEPDRILEAIGKYRVTHINFVPSMLDVLLDVIKDKDIDTFKGLKYAFVAGEALRSNLVKKFHSMFDGVKLENLYGPTEASIYGTGFSLKQSAEAPEVPIGKPIANMRAYILDKHLGMQPVGVAGELCLSGIGVARGYLNRPELTAEKFVSDPFFPGERMYRTGDLARWMDDGNIQFCGRSDHQVKLRGFRIELGEIEKNLLLQPAVGEAVVILREDHPDQKHLVAYLVMSRNMDISGDELRKNLGRRLPGYMVPSAFVKMEKLPRNPNGKVDRKALPPPEDVDRPLEKNPALPTMTEHKLIEITEELLNLKGLDANSNFFRLGGNSLLTIRFMSEIEKTFGISLSIIDFINLPSLAEIAKKIESVIQSGDHAGACQQGRKTVIDISKNYFNTNG